MSSRSLIHRITPFFAARLRENQRILSFSSASALNEVASSSSLSSSSQSASPSSDDVHMTENCITVCSLSFLRRFAMPLYLMNYFSLNLYCFMDFDSLILSALRDSVLYSMFRLSNPFSL